MSIKIFKNISYLCSHLLRKDILDREQIEAIVEEKMIENLGAQLYPNVKDVDATIALLKTQKKSMVRFGDGELQLIQGKDIPFQKFSERLSSRLKEILSSSTKDCLIGVPYFIYSSKQQLNDIPKLFWTSNGKKFRDSIAKYISPSNTYYAAEFTIASEAYKNFNCEKYWIDLQSIWQNKDITIICGETVFQKIRFNVFDNAKSIEYLYAPSVNAFDSYDDIFQKALAIDNSRLILVILGPTAKVLAYDLAQNGYMAIDIGHVAKAYDWYCKGKNTLQMKDAVDFFSPD